MIALIGTGFSRRVYAIGRTYAIKLPRVDSWMAFLYGLLANHVEAMRYETGWPELCPVVASLPGGFALIARRAKVCDDSPETKAAIEALCDAAAAQGRLVGGLAEIKASSWGWLDGRLVAVDYG